jgi:RimJ/RimL family protein N-acetyltransferase
MDERIKLLFSSFKVDEYLFLLRHDNENNKIIFSILKSETENFYNHTDVKKPNTDEDINGYFNGEKLFFDIFYKNEIVGVFDIDLKKLYLSYWVATKFHNLGIASRVLKKTSDEILHTGISKVFVNIKEENIASIRVAEKSGFVLSKRNIFEGNDVMLLFGKDIPILGK